MKAILLSFIILTILLEACTHDSLSYEKKWTNEIKTKIMQDANLKPDSSFYDSTKDDITYFHNGIQTKAYLLSVNKIDTLASYNYSRDQKFILYKVFCAAYNESYEVIIYNKIELGTVVINYCDQNRKYIGAVYGKENVGVWSTYDHHGNLIEEKQFDGLNDLIAKLRTIKYSR